MSKHSFGGTAAVIAALAVAPAHAVVAQEVSSALTLPFSTIAAGSSGGVQTTGSFRILQFAEQNGQAFAVGTLTVGVPDQASTTGGSVRSFVTQAVVPVLMVTSRTTTAALAFGGGNASATTAGSSAAGSTATPIGSTATPMTTAGVPTSSMPGQVANCGPLHVEVGPIDVNQSGITLHLDRLAVDIAPPSGGVSTMLSQAMCTADAALVQAANTGNTTGAGEAAVGVPTTGAPSAGSTTFGGMTTAGGTTMGGAFGGASSAAGGAFSGAAATPLQSFVSVLNQVIGML